MPFLITAIAIIVLSGVIKYIIIPLSRNKKIEEGISRFANDYHIEKAKAKPYDYLLSNDLKDVFLKIIPIPKDSAVTINNVSTWKLQWGGNPYKLGRSYPNERYLHEVINFIQSKPESDKPFIKIIILYPGTEKILRYLNESELDIITPDKTPYGYKVTTFVDFEKDFEILTNLK